MKGFYEQINKTSVFTLFLDGKVERSFCNWTIKNERKRMQTCKKRRVCTLCFTKGGASDGKEERAATALAKQPMTEKGIVRCLLQN